MQPMVPPPETDRDTGGRWVDTYEAPDRGVWAFAVLVGVIAVVLVLLVLSGDTATTDPAVTSTVPTSLPPIGG